MREPGLPSSSILKGGGFSAAQSPQGHNNHLLLNLSTTKDWIVDFSKKQQRDYLNCHQCCWGRQCGHLKTNWPPHMTSRLITLMLFWRRPDSIWTSSGSSETSPCCYKLPLGAQELLHLWQWEIAWEHHHIYTKSWRLRVKSRTHHPVFSLLPSGWHERGFTTEPSISSTLSRKLECAQPQWLCFNLNYTITPYQAST